MRKAIYGLTGLCILLVAFALIIPSLVEWNSYKDLINSEVRKATGRSLDIAGDVELSFLPMPHIRATDLRLRNAPSASVANMVTMKELRASIKLLPLLTGNVEIAVVELVEPLIELERRADGSANWEFIPATDTARPVSTPPTLARSEENGNRRQSKKVNLELLRVIDGTIIYRDVASQSFHRLENLTVDMSAGSMTGPFTARGGVSFKGIAFTLDAKVGKALEEKTLPFDVVLGAAGSDTRIVFKGDVSNIATSSPLIFARLDGKGTNFGSLVEMFSNHKASVSLRKPFTISASVEANVDKVDISRVEIVVRNSKITGGITARLTETPQINAAFHSASLDFDELFSGVANVPSRDTSAQREVKQQETTLAASADTDLPRVDQVAIPSNIGGSITLSIANATFGQGRVKNIRLEAALTDGMLTLNDLSAVLPGQTRARVSGQLSSPKGVMRFKGRSSIETADLRNIFKWLQVNVDGIPIDRLRRFALSADIGTTSQRMQITNISGQVDASRMRGDLSINLHERVAFNASLNVDQINADAYLRSRSRSTLATAPPVSSDVNAPSNRVSKTPIMGSTSSTGALSALSNFDADLRLRVGSLSYQGKAIRDVRLDGNLVNGELRLNDASIGSLAGTKVQVAGTLGGLERTPRFKGTVSATSGDLTGLFRLLGIKSFQQPRRFGRMRFVASTDVTPERVIFDSNLKLAEARVKVSGNISGLLDAPVFDLQFYSRHPEVTQAAALYFGGNYGNNAGPLTVKADVTGNADVMNIGATAEFTGGALEVSGKVGGLAKEPNLDLDVELDQPDFVRFVQLFYPAYKPSGSALGGLKLAAKLNGSGKKIVARHLAGNIGPTQVTGTGKYVHERRRPSLNLTLQSSTIPLSDFLKAPNNEAVGVRQTLRRNASRQAETPSSRQWNASANSEIEWSRAKIETKILGMLDADIDIRARALLYRGYRVDEPKILASLKNKVLNLRQVTGKMLGGTFGMRAQLDGRQTPILQASVQIADARVVNGFFEGDDLDIEVGDLSHELSITTSGQSQFEMIRLLNGNGRLSVVDGEARGFDLESLSRGLKRANLRNLVALGKAGFASIGRSKTTKFSSLMATIQITNGVISSRDVLLKSPFGNVAGSGTVDLPDWKTNIIADIRPRKVRELPKFRVTLTGPPDQPNLRFNFDELTKNLLSKGVGSFLRKVLPGTISNSGARPSVDSSLQSRPPPAREDPAEEIIKNIFENLRR